jgi:hypothetical protein
VDAVAPRELWDAIRNAEQIAEHARASAAADAQGASSGTRHIVRRAQGRPTGAPHVAPNCPPKAYSHAIERDTSFEYHPADPYGSASPPRSTARSRGVRQWRRQRGDRLHGVDRWGLGLFNMMGLNSFVVISHRSAQIG